MAAPKIEKFSMELLHLTHGAVDRHGLSGRRQEADSLAARPERLADRKVR